MAVSPLLEVDCPSPDMSEEGKRKGHSIRSYNNASEWSTHVASINKWLALQSRVGSYVLTLLKDVHVNA